MIPALPPNLLDPRFAMAGDRRLICQQASPRGSCNNHLCSDSKDICDGLSSAQHKQLKNKPKPQPPQKP